MTLHKPEWLHHLKNFIQNALKVYSEDSLLIFLFGELSTTLVSLDFALT